MHAGAKRTDYKIEVGVALSAIPTFRSVGYKVTVQCLNTLNSGMSTILNVYLFVTQNS